MIETFEDCDLGELAATVFVGTAMAFTTAVLFDDRARRTLLDPLVRVLRAAADLQKEKAEDQQRQARGTGPRATSSDVKPKKPPRDTSPPKPDYVIALFDKVRADLAFEEACADRALEEKKEGPRKS